MISINFKRSRIYLLDNKIEEVNDFLSSIAHVQDNRYFQFEVAVERSGTRPWN